MKEDTFKTDSQVGKFRGNQSSMKNRSSGFAESAINAINSVAPSGYEATAKIVTDSATEMFNMAGKNAKKAYGYISKHKYQTLGIIGAAGLAGAGYYLLSSRKASIKSVLPVLKKAKRASKKR